MAVAHDVPSQASDSRGTEPHPTGKMVIHMIRHLGREILEQNMKTRQFAALRLSCTLLSYPYLAPHYKHLTIDRRFPWTT